MRYSGRYDGFGWRDRLSEFFASGALFEGLLKVVRQGGPSHLESYKLCGVAGLDVAELAWYQRMVSNL